MSISHVADLIRPIRVQVCNKVVETERGVATTYKGNYTQYVQQKDENVAKQWTMFEKWNKEVQKQKDIIRRSSSCVWTHGAYRAWHELSRISMCNIESKGGLGTCDSFQVRPCEVCSWKCPRLTCVLLQVVSRRTVWASCIS